VISARLNKLG